LSVDPEAQPAASDGRCLPAHEGQRVWFLGNLMTIKCGGGPGDAMTFIEAQLHAGHAPPLHLHRHEDEAFYVLEGEVRFRCGSRDFEAVSGDYVFVPRGVPHAFKVGANGARALMVASSPQLAAFIVAGGEPAQSGPPPRSTADDLARVSELAARHDMNVVGPPLP